MALRLIDAGRVPFLRSQALYHGLAHARTASTPDTIVLATPQEPYVCIGLHQDAAHELDLDECRRRNLPVLRRETGGGAVLLDDRQLFVQWIMAPGRLPPRVDARFELFCGALAATYRAFGIDAAFRAPNDVHAGGRKISGTGAARLGEAEVLTGNFLFDFDCAAMAAIVRAPSPAFRTQVRRSLDRYMTSMRRELGRVPPTAAVAARCVQECARALGDEVVPGHPTVAELESIERLERALADDAFLAQAGGLRRPALKVHADVQVVERVVPLPAGTLRVTARLVRGRIEEVGLGAVGTWSGPALADLERSLAGVSLAAAPLGAALAQPEVAALVPALLALGRPCAPGHESTSA